MFSYSSAFEVDECEPLPARRLAIGLIKARGEFPAPDHEVSAARGRFRDEPVKKPPINNRPGKKNQETDEDRAAARFHRAIESGRGIDEQRADRGRAWDRKNMFGRVGKRSSIVVPVITADHEQRLANHCQLNHVHEKKLEGPDEEIIAPEKSGDTVDRNPAYDIDYEQEKADAPIAPEQGREKRTLARACCDKIARR